MNGRTRLLALLAGIVFATSCATALSADEEESLHEVPSEETVAETDSEEVAEELKAPDDFEAIPYPHFAINAEIFIDGQSVSRPQLVTLSDRPVQITQERSGEKVLAIEFSVNQKECGGLHVTGEVMTRNRVVHRIDNHQGSGDIIDLALIINAEAYVISLQTTVVDQS